MTAKPLIRVIFTASKDRSRSTLVSLIRSPMATRAKKISAKYIKMLEAAGRWNQGMIDRTKEVPEGYYTIRSLPIGEYFKLTERSRKVYVRGRYNGETYDCFPAEGMKEGIRIVEGSTFVYAGFTY